MAAPRAPLLALALALAALGASARADEAGLLQIHSQDVDKNRLDGLVADVVHADDTDRKPKLIALLKAMVQNTEDGEKYIEVQPLATSLLSSFREGWLGGEETGKAPQTADQLTEDFIKDIFFREGPAADAADLAAARAMQGLAAAASASLNFGLPRYEKVLQGAELLLRVAQFGSQRVGMKNLAGAAKFLGQQALPSMRGWSDALETGLQYVGMVNASVDKDQDFAVLNKAGHLMLDRVRKYEKDMVTQVEKTKSFYKERFGEAQKGVYTHPGKHQSMTNAAALAGTYAFASFAIDQGFNFWKQGFHQFVETFSKYVEKQCGLGPGLAPAA